MNDRVLTLDDLSITYKNKSKEVYACKNASLHINKGDALGVVGESGSGKSTLAMGLLRLLPEKSTVITGSVDFLGQDLLKMTQQELNEIRWKKLAVVFQKAMNSFSPVHRIGAQIEDIYKIHEPNATTSEVQHKISELLKLVNLNERVYKLYPHELSGGMLQRVSIAVSMMHKPQLLILDEATTALDVVTQGQILEEIRNMEQEMDLTRIMITHDMSVVAASCNRVAVMYAGDIMEVGPVQKVLKTPAHPYTMGLLGSFPSLKGENGRLTAIKGSIPDLSQHYDSCIFAPRCPYVMEVCRKKRPEMVAVEQEWSARCYLCGGDK